MYSEEIRSSELAKKLLVFDLVYMDTCSLMDDAFPIFMDLLVKSRYYWKKKVSIKVLPEVYAELTKHASNEENRHLRVSAARALKILKHDGWRLWNRTIIVDKSKDNDGFADNAIFTEVSTWRIKKKVLVITQDKKLTTDLKKQNSLDSQRGRFVIIYRINQKGELEENPGETDTTSKFKKPNGISSAPANAKPSQQPKQNKQQQAKKEEPTKTKSGLEQIILNDKRIAANLNNKNYPLEKKVADLEAQIELISKEDKKAVDNIKLSYPLPRLKDALSAIKKPAKPQENAKKPAEKKDNKKNSEPTEQKPAIWYEFGTDPFEASIKACTSKSIIPHRKEIAYSKAGHGDANIVIEELAERLSKAKFNNPGDSVELRFQNHVIYIEKTDKDFRSHVELVPSEPKPKKTPKAPKAPKENKQPVEAPVVEAKEDIPVEEPAPVEEAKPTEEVKPIEESKPVEAVVEENKAAETEKPAKAPKKACKPKAKKTAKVEETPKDNQVEEPKVEEPKEESKEDESKKVSVELKAALDSEKVLRCNVQNPNYPAKKKITALEAQIEKVRALKDSERRKLTWGIRELQKRLSELQKESE